MNTAMLLTALLQYGPAIIPLIQKLVSDIEAGKGSKTVTSDDLAELAKLSAQTGESIYARMGLTPPPATPA